MASFMNPDKLALLIGNGQDEALADLKVQEDVVERSCGPIMDTHPPQFVYIPDYR